MNKTIEHLITSSKINMGGFIVDQPLPSSTVSSLDPFLLLHHANHKYRGGRRASDIGIGPHPHRGFSPVTFIFKGEIHHRDSRGNNQIVGEGGMQWMSAGMGIIHSERPSARIAENGGQVEIIQLWVNTPAKHKMDQPYYLPITNEEVTSWSENEGKVKFKLYSGEIMGKTGPAKTPFPVNLLRVDFQNNGKTKLEIPEGFATAVYQLNGSTLINGTDVRSKQLAIFNNEGTTIEIEALDNTQLILMSGKPLNEPIESYGPYVMTNQTEILQAMRDYQMGKMGILIEEFD